MLSTVASANTISYNTLGSTLSCASAANCVQTTAATVVLGNVNGQISLTYIKATGLNVAFPGPIDLGHVDISVTGTPGTFSLNGILLTINVNSLPPGAGGTLPNGAFSGSISASSSTAVLTFAPNNTSSGLCPACPGVVIGAGASSYLYQVSTSTVSLPAPIGGVGASTTSAAIAAAGTVSSGAIGGVVSTPGTATPEPGSLFLLSSGLIGLRLLRKRPQP